jgi:hypothetical protein
MPVAKENNISGRKKNPHSSDIKKQKLNSPWYVVQ